MLTNKGEKEYDRALRDLQAPLRGSAGQPSGTDALVPAGGVPQRVLHRPPNPGNEEKGPGESVAPEATHDPSLHLEERVDILNSTDMYI